MGRAIWRALSELLRGVPGPPFVVDEDAVDGVVESVRSAVNRLVTVEVPERPTRRTFLTALGAGLGFPQSFGANWDAWEDSLHGLYEESGDSYLVVIRRADRLLASPPTLFAQVVYHLQTTQDTIDRLRNGEMRLQFLFSGQWDS